MFRLSLFGPVTLSGPTGPLTGRVVQQRRLALLALMGTSPDAGISRDRVLGLLWPESREETARHLLSDSIYVLRRALGPAAIRTAGSDLQLAPAHVSVDVREFLAALGSGDWRSGLARYRGPLLDGFFVRNAAEFDQWASAERARLQREATWAASSLAADLAANGELPESVRWAERALELAPYDEAAARRLVALLVQLDNRTRADAVARSFVDQLHRDLGTAPSEETRRVFAEAGTGPGPAPVVVYAAPGGQRPLDITTRNIFLQGRDLWRRRTSSSVRRAVGYFDRAVQRDPNSAEAWAALADAWIVQGGRGYVPIAEAIARAGPCVERALALDDGLSAAHTSAGGLAILRRTWRDADQALRRAIAIQPDNPDPHHWLSLTLMTGFGDREAALREQQVAAQLNPLAPLALAALGWELFLLGRFEESREQFEQAVDLDTDFEEGHAGLARACAWLGDGKGAERALQAGLARRGDLRAHLLAEWAAALATMGDRAGARARVQEAETAGAEPMLLGLAWATLGEVDAALRAIADAARRPYWVPQALWWDPRLDALRNDPRFADVDRPIRAEWRPLWS